MRQSFFKDNEGIDTVPLKMVIYLVVTGWILVLVSISWNAIVPVKHGYDVEKQLSEASLELLSLQRGKARDLYAPFSSEGSMCSIELDFPPEITYVGFGVDPDPDNDGNVKNSDWNAEKNTIIYRYDNGLKKRWIIEAEQINFCQGIRSDTGRWFPIDTFNSLDMGIVIEKPVSGSYVFELVRGNVTYTLSHFPV